LLALVSRDEKQEQTSMLRVSVSATQSQYLN